MSFYIPKYPKWVWIEITSRFIIILIFFITDDMWPFIRVIQPGEAYLYRYPNNASYISSNMLWVIVVGAIICVIIFVYLVNGDLNLALTSIAVSSLALPITGIITNLMKISVGRPRPDYLNRCYGPEYLGITDLSKPCTETNMDLIMDGRKSFPSGHSSLSFCGFGFIAIYIAGQMKTFSSRRGHSLSILAFAVPLLSALMVAISRTCDYHHHYQDVGVGSIIGLTVSYTIYRQYFPCLSKLSCDKPNVSMEGYVKLSQSESDKNTTEISRELFSAVKIV